MNKDFLRFLYNEIDDYEFIYGLFYTFKVTFTAMNLEEQENYFYRNIKNMYDNNLIDFFEHLPRKNNMSESTYNKIHPILTKEWLHYQMYVTKHAKELGGTDKVQMIAIYYAENGLKSILKLMDED